MSNNHAMADSLQSILNLAQPPIGISFLDHVPDNPPAYESSYPTATDDGRTGAVSAGCVFWMKAADQAFSTVPSDHGNCSVGSLTHGLIELGEAATKADVQAICDAKWVDPEIFPHIPTMNERPKSIVYEPLASASRNPDVVLIRVNAKQAMQLHSAIPALRHEGKPQCHIIPIAAQENQPALSVGCMLSRVRTGMSNNEMTCALPFDQLAEVIESLQAVCESDHMVAGYASVISHFNPKSGQGFVPH